MEFKIVLEKILGSFQKQKIDYALIGGFALGVWGINRATLDLDFLVSKKDLGKLDIIMKELGYQCAFQSENVSQYISDLRIFGEVDFVHAFRKLSLKMLDRAEEKDIFNDNLKIKVLRIEDLIGLKLQAFSNDASRKIMDLQDIDALLTISYEKINWDDLKEYFQIFGLNDLFNELKRKFF